jgi:hypothetical protein
MFIGAVEQSACHRPGLACNVVLLGTQLVANGIGGGSMVEEKIYDINEKRTGEARERHGCHERLA